MLWRNGFAARLSQIDKLSTQKCPNSRAFCWITNRWKQNRLPVAGVTLADRAERKSRCGHARPYLSRWDRAVWRHPIGRVLVRSRVDASQHTRRRRHRARAHGICECVEWGAGYTQGNGGGWGRLTALVMESPRLEAVLLKRLRDRCRRFNIGQPGFIQHFLLQPLVEMRTDRGIERRSHLFVFHFTI